MSLHLSIPKLASVDPKELRPGNGLAVFFGWTPLHLLTASAASRLCLADCPVFIWLGKRTSPWHEILDATGGWQCCYDLSSLCSVGFRRYWTEHSSILAHVCATLRPILELGPIREFLLPTDDEYVSLTALKVYRKLTGESPWPLVSLYEEGSGLYQFTRPPRPFRAAAKMVVDQVVGPGVSPLTLGFLAGNRLIRRIYAIFPDAIPLRHAHEIIDIGAEFQRVCSSAASAASKYSALPQGSALILSENRSSLLTPDFEHRLIRRMVDRARRHTHKVFVKFHHNDSPDKRQLYDSLGVTDEVAAPDMPYELLHSRLRPSMVLSLYCSSMMYCAVQDGSCKFVAFCGAIGWRRRLAELFASCGIEVEF